MENPIKVVPVKELKQQIDKKMARDFTSINPAPGVRLDESWNKNCPCEEEEEENCTIIGFCESKFGITMRGGRPEGYTLIVLTFRKSNRSYFMQNVDYRDLINEGRFAACRTEEIGY